MLTALGGGSVRVEEAALLRRTGEDASATRVAAGQVASALAGDGSSFASNAGSNAIIRRLATGPVDSLKCQLALVLSCQPYSFFAHTLPCFVASHDWARQMVKIGADSMTHTQVL